jgi:hypothetical protein
MVVMTGVEEVATLLHTDKLSLQAACAGRAREFINHTCVYIQLCPFFN